MHAGIWNIDPSLRDKQGRQTRIGRSTMIKTVRRLVLGSIAATTGLLAAAGPAWAHECVNASKNQSAGVQIVIDGNTGEIVWLSNGLQERIEQGLVNPLTGEGFSGLIGFDLNGDGTADVSTFIVGSNMELPAQAQFNGPACHGITNVEVFFTQCMS
ncbi:MAG TPA: hypothetical protein VFY84_07410 [Jiangellales bacterium]|nr:hypothetical protein [Jiangellales bacterium]